MPSCIELKFRKEEGQTKLESADQQIKKVISTEQHQEIQVPEPRERKTQKNEKGQSSL